MSVPVVECVNVQLALNAYAPSAGRYDFVDLQSDIGNYGGVSLTAMVTRAWNGPGEAARQYIAVDVGADGFLARLRAEEAKGGIPSLM